MAPFGCSWSVVLASWWTHLSPCPSMLVCRVISKLTIWSELPEVVTAGGGYGATGRAVIRSIRSATAVMVCNSSVWILESSSQ